WCSNRVYDASPKPCCGSMAGCRHGTTDSRCSRPSRKGCGHVSAVAVPLLGSCNRVARCTTNKARTLSPVCRADPRVFGGCYGVPGAQVSKSDPLHERHVGRGLSPSKRSVRRACPNLEGALTCHLRFRLSHTTRRRSSHTY